MPASDVRERLDRAIDLLDDPQRERLLAWAGVINRGVENARAPGSTPGPLADFLAITNISTSPEETVYTLQVTPQTLNPHGVLHGGAVYVMVDYSMGGATMAAVAENQICATIEIKISYLASVREGTLTARTRIIKRGRAVVFLESHVTDDQGRLVAAASGSFAIIPLQPADRSADG